MPRDTTGYEEDEVRGTLRGTRNVQVSRGATRTRHQPVHSEHGKVVEDFAREKSVQARVRSSKTKNRQQQEREEQNEAEAWRAARNEEAEYQSQVMTGRMRGVRTKTARVSSTLKEQAGYRLSWILLSIVSAICYIKAVLMLMALGIYTLGQYEFFWGAFNLDDVASTLSQPLVWVGLMEEGIRISALGIAAWAVAAAIMLLSYLILIFYYSWWQGIDVFGSVAAFLITTLAIALDVVIIPLNVFPWMVLWVLYINANSLFLTRRSPVKRA